MRVSGDNGALWVLKLKMKSLGKKPSMSWWDEIKVKWVLKRECWRDTNSAGKEGFEIILNQRLHTHLDLAMDLNGIRINISLNTSSVKSFMLVNEQEESEV